MKWSLDQLADLRRLYGSRSNAWLAKRFGCLPADVTAKASELALGKNKRTFQGTPMPRWTPDQIAVLRKRYASTPNIDLALLLQKSVKGVTSKASKLGLRKDPKHLETMGRTNVSLRRGRK